MVCKAGSRTGEPLFDSLTSVRGLILARYVIFAYGNPVDWYNCVDYVGAGRRDVQCVFIVIIFPKLWHRHVNKDCFVSGNMPDNSINSFIN
jgi:hypothetical protein